MSTQSKIWLRYIKTINDTHATFSISENSGSKSSWSIAGTNQSEAKHSDF